MSQLSGRCDLLDHIFGMGGLYDARTHRPVKFNEEGVYAYVSDLLQDFNEFKKQTGGVIYQHKEIKLENWMGQKEFDFIKSHCKGFDYKADETAGRRKYIFTYYGKEYTLKDLKKKGIYVEVSIQFNTLLDLLPYFPYVISISCVSDGKQYVVIAGESEVEYERNRSIKLCSTYSCYSMYVKAMNDLYLEVCRHYFLYKEDERINYLFIDRATKVENGNYQIKTENPIDYMHDLEFVWDDGKNHLHWTSPKLVDEHTIEIHKEDFENRLKDDIKLCRVRVKYIEKPEEGFPLWLE